MESDGRWIGLKEIEDLLKWQYNHLVELDDYMMTHAKGYRSVFLKDSAWYNKTFIGQTIIRFYQFRNEIGKGLLFKNRPISDFIEEIDSDNKWLVDFKKKRKSVYRTLDIGETYIGLHVVKLIHVLTGVTAYIIDLEYEHVKNLDSSLAKQAVRKKLFELESEKIKTNVSCRLRDGSREKEYKLYELLAQHLASDDSGISPEASKQEKERIQTIMLTIMNTCDGNVINTGNHTSIKADIDQNNTQSISTPNSLIAEVQQLTEQVRNLLDKIDSIEPDIKEEVSHQVTTVERQISKENPNISLIGKSMQIIESLLLDAATNEFTPLILEGIRHLLPQLTK